MQDFMPKVISKLAKNVVLNKKIFCIKTNKLERDNIFTVVLKGNGNLNTQEKKELRRIFESVTELNFKSNKFDFEFIQDDEFELPPCFLQVVNSLKIDDSVSEDLKRKLSILSNFSVAQLPQLTSDTKKKSLSLVKAAFHEAIIIRKLVNQFIGINFGDELLNIFLQLKVFFENSIKDIVKDNNALGKIFEKTLRNYVTITIEKEHKGLVSIIVDELKQNLGKLEKNNSNYLKLLSAVDVLECRKEYLSTVSKKIKRLESQFIIVKEQVIKMNEYMLNIPKEYVYLFINNYKRIYNDIFDFFTCSLNDLINISAVEQEINYINKEIDIFQEVINFQKEYLFNQHEDYKQKKRELRCKELEQAKTGRELSLSAAAEVDERQRILDMSAYSTQPQLLDGLTLHGYKLAMLKQTELKSSKRYSKYDVLSDLSESDDMEVVEYRLSSKKESLTFKVNTHGFLAEDKEDTSKVFQLGGLRNNFIVNLNLYNDDNLFSYFKVIEKNHDKFLQRNSLGTSGIKIHDPDWLSVKVSGAEGDGDRLICIRISKDNINLYIPCGIVTHSNYENLLNQRKGPKVLGMQSKISNEVKLEYATTRIPSLVLS